MMASASCRVRLTGSALLDTNDDVVTATWLGPEAAALNGFRWRLNANSAHETGESTGATGLPPEIGSTRAVAAAVTRPDTLAVVLAGTRAEVVGATGAPVPTGVINWVVEPLGKAVALGATPVNVFALTVLST